jgi:hypothetical protein
MHTMQDFELASQASEYLLGIFGLIVFAFFWRALNKPSKRRG